MSYVLDCSAVLAVVFDEPGRERVSSALPESRLSAVNLAEVVTKLTERGVAAEDLRAVVAPFLGSVAAFDEDLAIAAGALRADTRTAGLSLGDRACLALAQRDGATALTADRAWARVEIGVPVELIR